MAENFKAKVKKKLQELDVDDVVWFAWRCAVRALPYLGVKGNFRLWTQDKDLVNLYTVFLAIDLAATDDDGLHDFNYIEVSPPLHPQPNAVIYSVNAAVCAHSSAYSLAFGRKAARRAHTWKRKKDVDIALVDASVEAIDSSVRAAVAFAAIAADEYRESIRSLLGDIERIKNGNAKRIPICPIVWARFVQTLKDEGCKYWVNVIEQWFADGCVKDTEALERRLNVPEEIREKGAAEVANYLEALEKQGTTRMNETRLIILGEKGAGKTCLARKLVDPNAEMTTEDESTAGVDTSVWKLDQMNIRIWDFAGHTVTHAVHKFFLSERCLYVLVYDGRTEERNRLEYWLDHVKNYGGDSEVMILVNLRDSHTPRLPINTLKEKHPIHSVVFLSIQDDIDRLENFRGVVSDYILNKASWNVANFPKSYDAVKNELEGLFDSGNGSSEFITRDKFNVIAKRHEVERPEILLSHLHVLGISLWYNEMARYNTMVLNPEWISLGVYQIINWAHEAKKYQLTLEDFKMVFEKNADRFPENKHEFLYELMKHYELAYETEDCEKCLVIPHLLDEDQPATLPEFPLGGALMLRYRSETDFPPDTISRFIVQRHQEIRSPEFQNVWQKGVILNDGKGSIAMVREESRMITVQVTGASRSDYIAELRQTLNNIFDTYQSDRPDLQYRVERFGDQVARYDGAAPIWLSEQKVMNQYADKVPYYDDVTKTYIPLGYVVDDYRMAGTAARHGRLYSIEDITDSERDVRPEVYVSYKWNEQSKSVVDQLAQAFDGTDIKLMRDTSEMKYQDSIRQFMQRIGQGRAIVIVVSDEYLKSENCMFELLEIARAGAMGDRIFPIVLGDAQIYKASHLVRYLKYWDDEIDELDEGLKQLKTGVHANSLQQSLNMYADIRRLFDSITHVIGDMNAFSLEQHIESNFQHVIDKVRERV